MIKVVRTEQERSVYPVPRYALEGVHTAQTNSPGNEYIRVNQKCRPKILNWRSNFLSNLSLSITRGFPTRKSPTSTCNVETRLDLKHNPESRMIRYLPGNQAVRISAC